MKRLNRALQSPALAGLGAVGRASVSALVPKVSEAPWGRHGLLEREGKWGGRVPPPFGVLVLLGGDSQNDGVPEGRGILRPAVTGQDAPLESAHSRQHPGQSPQTISSC